MNSSSNIVKAVVSIAGPTDFTDTTLLKNQSLASCIYELTGSEASNELLKASPINYVNEQCPPTLMLHGTADGTIPYGQAELLHQKLNSYNSDNLLVPFEDGWHEFMFSYKTEVFSQSFNWFEKYLKK